MNVSQVGVDTVIAFNLWCFYPFLGIKITLSNPGACLEFAKIILEQQTDMQF